MRRLLELLKTLEENSMVEWKKLGEICVSLKKEIIKQDNLVTNGKYPVVNSGVTLYGRYNEYNNNGNAFTFASRGEYAGFLTYMSEDFWAGGLCYPYRSQDEEKYLTKFIYEYLKSQELYVMDRLVARGGIPALNKADVEKIQIPVPSITEQTRIVGILDTFTASIENLKQQIAQRRKQYEHYRDQLLDLEGKEGNSIKCWGGFCEMVKGNGVQKVDFVDSGKGCIHYGQIYTYYGSYAYSTNKFVSEKVFKKAKKASYGDLIMTDTSENVEDICKTVAYLGKDDIAVSNHALIIKHHQNPRFLSYSTQTNSFLIQKRKVVVGVKVSGIKPEHLAQIKIYLPSIEEQSRIVSILDTFEASIANLEQQLAQRERQYEYYRNKLLTFE